jgi:hypothetical protein
VAIIACLGWGSLVWDPRGLHIQRPWFSDGPFAQIEFLRESKGGRITLVVDAAATVRVRSLWAVVDANTLVDAREGLRGREEIPPKDLQLHIGSWSRGDVAPALFVELDRWAEARGIDSVVWTALPPKFNGNNGLVPSSDQVVARLSGLTGRARENAERYIRFAPPQIDTPYRRRIEAALQWTPLTPPS